MASTFATMGSQAFAAHEESVRNPDFAGAGRLHTQAPVVIADFGMDLKSTVEAKSAKARAQARWRMLRSLVHNLEFPKFKISDDSLRIMNWNVPKLEGEFLSRPVITTEWVSQLQDFWYGSPALPKLACFTLISSLLPHILRREQANKNRQRILLGRGPKKSTSAHPRSLSARIRVTLNVTPRIFEPGSNFVVGWALIQAILLLYITIVVPFTAVFLADLNCFPDWSITLDLVIDTYFIADMLVTAVRLGLFVSLNNSSLQQTDTGKSAGISLQNAVGQIGAASNHLCETLFENPILARCDTVNSCCLVASWAYGSILL